MRRRHGIKKVLGSPRSVSRRKRIRIPSSATVKLAARAEVAILNDFLEGQAPITRLSDQAVVLCVKLILQHSYGIVVFLGMTAGID